VNDESYRLDKERLTKILDGMSREEREHLEARSKSGSRSLTLDEVGILFLMAREKIRE
jgi:DNA-directed RNA polymerase sigma subunit (sigma70/sigma32)